MPQQHLLATSTSLYIGVSDAEFAARGQSQSIYEYFYSCGIYRLRSFSLNPPCERLAFSPDGTKLYGLSRLRSCLVRVNLTSGLVEGRDFLACRSPVSFTLAA